MKLAWRSGILAYHDLHSCRNISALQFESMHPRLASELRKLNATRMSPIARWWTFRVKKLPGKYFYYNGMLAWILRDACSMNLHTLSGPPLFINQIRATQSLSCLWETRNDPSGPMQWHGRPHGDSCPHVAPWSQYDILKVLLRLLRARI